jgi:hypothetical protein
LSRPVRSPVSAGPQANSTMDAAIIADRNLLFDNAFTSLFTISFSLMILLIIFLFIWQFRFCVLCVKLQK